MQAFMSSSVSTTVSTKTKRVEGLLFVVWECRSDVVRNAAMDEGWKKVAWNGDEAWPKGEEEQQIT